LTAERSVDRFLGAKHRPDYNCLHFAADVWRAEVGEDLHERLEGLAMTGRAPSASQRRGFQRLARPSSPCVVIMTRPHMEAHVGVYLRDRVLHLTEQGASFVPLHVAAFGYKEVRFYR
jgi:hypothetical protein